MKRLLPLLPMVLSLGSPLLSAADSHLVYFGGYTNAKSGSKGIYVSRFDDTTGKLSAPELAAETANPSFLAIHPSKKFLYAVGEMPASGGQGKGGALSAFRIDPATGKLTLLNQSSVIGKGPCHVSTDRSGKMAMIANYSSGSIASFAIAPDGRLSEAVSFHQNSGSGPDAKRQEGPHAHSINPDPANHFALSCDLGTDEVLVFRMDPEKGALTPHGKALVPPGSGPRHLAFHPNGRFVFVNNEMLMTTTSFSYDAAKGSLSPIETVSTLPPEDRSKTGLSTAETVAHPNGRFVYVSNRTHDTLAVFRCDPDSGKLQLIQNISAGGKIPRNFALDPSARWMLVAHQDSHSVAVFSVDPQTGQLHPTGQTISVGAPVCVRFLPLESK
jgi:6-phosphogluconolactonase